ncbi:hypothetical protein DFJ58DRAFT_73326 [Suillus subalutaceus]|uniref:uncharacterized protein n=1 Tax=Suillus subalutaceus TaxID=48586 RepID=UPI001B863E6E|nr:uncharacterized protein DFJ58DRAFT_73326 [Suillus subalutaceus]KAG1841562.1 hypothetical protein DFJ58DRAFT_73326 [Suillus subalutaceus]
MSSKKILFQLYLNLNVQPCSHYTPSAQVALLPPRGVNNVFIVLVTIVVYDFVTNLGDELNYLLSSRMTLAKGLFLGCRYTPFVICALHARMDLSPSVEGCPGLVESNILLLGIVLLCAECVFILRTYALWNCDRRVRIALLVSYLGFFCGMTILVVASGLQSNIANFAPGCYTSTSVSAVFILAPYIFLLLLEIEIVGLTLYRMIRHYRATRCRLLTLLAQYSVGYIVAGLLFTIVNIATICFVPGDYGPMLEGSQIVAQGLLATRMQLDLWRLNRHSPAVAPASYSTEYDQTDLEFELSQRASTIPSGTVR